MTTLRLEDRLAIEDRLNRYSWASDERRFDLLAECFTEDATFRLEVAGIASVETIRGKTAIVDWFRERRIGQDGQQRRHTTSGLVVEAVGANDATVASYVTVILVATGRLSVAATGWYRDCLRRETGGWLIADRFVHLDAVA